MTGAVTRCVFSSLFLFIDELRGKELLQLGETIGVSSDLDQ